MFAQFLERCYSILELLSTSAVAFWDWLFLEIDGGILGTVQPIQFISFITISSFLVARIILAINS